MSWKVFFQTLLTAVLSAAATGAASGLAGATQQHTAVAAGAGAVVGVINHFRTPPGA